MLYLYSIHYTQIIMKIRKISISLLLVGLLLLIGCKEISKDKDTGMEEIENIAVEESKKLRHLVLFNFKENVSADSIAIVERAFSELPSKIKEIRGFEWGTDNSPEGVAKGFTHSFLVTFHREEDRAIYLPHPDHKNFSAIVDPLLEDVLVLDYWAN